MESVYLKMKELNKPDLPEILYYKFTPINESLITESKKGIIIDKEIERAMIQSKVKFSKNKYM